MSDSHHEELERGRFDSPIATTPDLAAATSTLITTTPARYSGRIGGIDIARALAIFGMFYAHVGKEWWGNPVAEFLAGIPDGRSSILFALLAGVSLSIITGRNVPFIGEEMRAARLRVVGRSCVLLIIAAILGALGTAVAIILAYYAAWFVAALPFSRWSARKLFIAAAVFAVAGPLVTNLTVNWFLPGLSIWPGGDPNTFLFEVFITGTYPGLVYMAFVLAGMGIGRLELTSTANHVRFVASGVVLMMCGYGASWPLTNTIVDDVVGPSSSAQGMETAAQASSWNPGLTWVGSPFPDLYSFVTAEPHTGTVFEAVGSGGFAIAVLGVCLLVGNLAGTVLYPLAAAGSMSLTVYSAHIVAIAFNPEWIFSESSAPILWLVGTSLVVCPLLKLRFRRGPLEWIMWRASQAAAHVPE